MQAFTVVPNPDYRIMRLKGEGSTMGIQMYLFCFTFHRELFTQEKTPPAIGELSKVKPVNLLLSQMLPDVFHTNC